MDLKIKLKKMEQAYTNQFLLELLSVVIALAAVVFGTAYSTVVTVANGGRWWSSPLLLMIGIIVVSTMRYAFRAWRNQLSE